MTVTADALDLLAGDPPRYPHVPGDFHRHPETGAPYVNHPTETRKDGTPKRVMYGRPSSFGVALDNPFSLIKWKDRKELIGAAVLELDYEYILANRDNDKILDGLAAQCYDAADAHLAADQGTFIHKILEWVDRIGTWADLIHEGEKLGIPYELQRHIVQQWRAFRARLGLTALAVEQTVVNDRWRLAGTLDRLDVGDHDILTAYGILEAGVPFVGDIKTGGLTLGNDGQPNYWVKYPVQLAAYVDAVPYDTETDKRGWWPNSDIQRIGDFPNPHIALIYHYDLARALNGEPVDWQAIPVNVDAGREGGDLCRAAADFAKRRDLFAMPAPTIGEPCADTTSSTSGTPLKSSSTTPAPTTPAPTSMSGFSAKPSTTTSKNDALAEGDPSRARPQHECGQRPERCVAGSTSASESADDEELPGMWSHSDLMGGDPDERSYAERNSAADRDRLRARIADLIAQGHEQVIRREWPEGVAPLSKPYHTDDDLLAILAAVRRVETEVGAAWHLDDGPPPHVNTNPRAEVAYPATPVIDAGGWVNQSEIDALQATYDALGSEARELCIEIAMEAHQAGRSISVSASPTVRRWTIARAVIAWAASGRTVDDLWFTASLLATFEQTRDPASTLGGLISQFTIEQANRLYESATNQ